jgi:hypothetical protein
MIEEDVLKCPHCGKLVDVVYHIELYGNKKGVD